MIEEAAAFAAKAHEGAFRKGTRIPYITHPMETALIVSGFTRDEELIAAALLHDVVEDTDVTIEELEEEFPKEVTEALRLLTHDISTDYFEYVRALRKNPVARTVKMADLEHNSDQSRLTGCDIPEEKIAWWEKKYEKAKKILE